MLPSPRCPAVALLLAGLTGACSALLPSSTPPTPAAPMADPTPLARCKVAASATSPLVTEWPASEKAHLQSLVANQLVAVNYSGCDLRIIDACKLPGTYRWQRTTLATDTVEIGDADELFAKLPIGAFSLEGELKRSGRLAVRTTVAGQLKLEGTIPSTVPSEGPCAQATHLVTAISVGAFKLLSGSSVTAGGGVGVVGVGAETHAKREETILREAGVQSACSETTDEEPNNQCASPIQLFLAPLRQKEELDKQQAARRAGAVYISFAAPEDPDETWTLRDQGGNPLCQLPCGDWVAPASGYYLQREMTGGHGVATVKLPESYPYPPGTRLSAEYQEERGSPLLSTLTFYGAGVPMGIMGTIFATAGIVQLASGMDCDQADCAPFPSAGFNLAVGIMYLSFGGAAAWWYFYSQRERVDTYEEDSEPQAARSGPHVVLGPGWVGGTF